MNLVTNKIPVFIAGGILLLGVMVGVVLVKRPQILAPQAWTCPEDKVEVSSRACTEDCNDTSGCPPGSGQRTFYYCATAECDADPTSGDCRWASCDNGDRSDPNPTSTPPPLPTATPVVTIPRGPTPTLTPTPTPTGILRQTPTPTATPVLTATPAPPTNTPIPPTDVPTATIPIKPTNTPTATPISLCPVRSIDNVTATCGGL